MKLLTVFLIFLFLYSCGGGGSNSSKSVRKENVLQVINVPTNIETKSINMLFSSSYPGYIFDVESNGKETFFVNVEGLYILNTNQPNEPKVIEFLRTDEDSLGLFVDDKYAYIANGKRGITVVDISNLKNPKIVKYIDLPKGAVDVFVTDRYIYAVNMDGFYIVDREAPETVIGYLSTDGEAIGIHIRGNYGYIADSRNGLIVVDIKNPQNPRPVKIIKMPDDALDVFVDREKIYVAVYNEGVIVIKNDISNPEFLYKLKIDSYVSGVCVCNRGYIYIADIIGFKVVSQKGESTASNSNSEKKSEDTMNNKSIAAQSSLEPVRNQRKKPWKENPYAEAGYFYDSNFKNEYNDLELYAKNKTYIYTVDVDSFLILDKNSRKPISRFHVNGNINDLIVNDEFAYIITDDSVLLVLDISDERNIKLVSTFDTEEKPVDIKLDFKKDELYIFEEHNILEILDISNPYNPFLLYSYRPKRDSDG